jgi:type I site-specific restriction-modification system R (restriction) subunit
LELLTHQKIVRDYLNIDTPYRGFLYHGLGSGKTCTSIAIAEGMKSEKHVFVLTPRLRDNFSGVEEAETFFKKRTSSELEKTRWGG